MCQKKKRKETLGINRHLRKEKERCKKAGEKFQISIITKKFLIKIVSVHKYKNSYYKKYNKNCSHST